MWTDLRARFPFLDWLEAHAATFRAEADALVDDDFMPMPSAENYQGVWRAFPLALGVWEHEFPGVDFARNRARCPRTTALLTGLPGFTVGGFLKLEPGTSLRPHRDIRDDDTIRAHLGLHLPASEQIYWREGTARVMDIRQTHSAENPGPGPRVTLMVDVRMPFVIPEGVIPPWGTSQD